MTKAYDYDLAVLGGGSGGLTAAVGATKLGLRVVLINGGLLGGDCLNFGCVPSKALLQAAKVARSARHAARFGVEIPTINFDYSLIKARVRSVQDKIREHEDAPWFRAMGMDVIEEYASFVDPHTIQAGGKKVTARLVLIATGSRAAIRPIPGLEDAGFVTNEHLFDMPALPRHLAIIGGGPIGTEMAFAHRQFGCEVTMIEYGPGILGKDDPDMARVVQNCLEEDGVRILTNAQVVATERAESGRKLLHVKRGEAEQLVEADEILLAAGRQPNVESLSLEKAGVEYSPRGIVVDASQRTNVPHIYAVGDVTGGYMFTHAAGMEAGTFIRRAIFHLPAKTRYDAFPWCTYTEPELASVGLNETEAKKRGVPYELAVADFAENDRALAEGTAMGKVKVLIEPSRMMGLGGGRILGAQIVGPHAGELIHEFVALMKSGAKASSLSGMVHAYPTLSEVNKRAISTMLGEKLFQPRTRIWLKRLFGFAGRQDPSKEASHA